MTQTTNYGLNVVEGSDTVNLLTQMNPNTEKIDAQMKTNEDHGIQEATELFTSTVHAITRLKPDAKVFRFTAVSNYTAGETFTVDGVQVTALLTSGEALTTGSFIIGSEVICALRDTLLTVFVNAGTASIAKNAEKLGGELPSYYGTAEDVSSAVSNAGTAHETATAVSGAVGNLSALTTVDKSSCVAAINSLNSNLNVISEEIQTLKSDDWKFLGSYNIGVAGSSFTLPSDWKEVAITLKPNDTVGGVALGTHLKCAIINSAITQARFGTYNYGIVYNISNDGNTFTYADYFSASMASSKIDVYYK